MEFCFPVVDEFTLDKKLFLLQLQDMELEEKETFMKNPVPKAEPEETTNI